MSSVKSARPTKPLPQESALLLARLSDDWQTRYAHPVLVVETFVDRKRRLECHVAR